MHTDVGKHSCAPAVTMRLTRDFLVVDAKLRRWRGAQNGMKTGDFSGASGRDIFQVQPVIVSGTSSDCHDVMHPAPASLDIVLRYKYLTEARRPAFVIHQGSTG